MEFWITILLVLAIALFTAYLVHFYASKTTPLYVKLTCFFAWFLGFLFIGVLPLDIFYAKQSSQQTPHQSPTTTFTTHNSGMRIIWNLVYWTSYVLCWLVLPLMMNYLMSGHFTFRHKLAYAIKRTLLFNAIGAVLAIVFILYLAINSNIFKHGIKAVFVAIGNTWGLLLIIFFLGNGIMEVPRYYWNRIHKNDRYDILLCQIAQIHEDQEQVKFELEEHAEVAIGLEPHTPIQLRPYLQEIIYKIPEDARESNYMHSMGNLHSTPKTVKLSTLAYLNYKVMASLSSNARLKSLFTRKTKEVFNLEKLEEMDDLQDEKTGFEYFKGMFSWVWLIKIKPKMYYIGFGLWALFSFFVVLGEATLFSDKNFALFGLFINQDNLTYIQTIITTFIPLTMLAMCTYNGIFNFKISGFYGLYPHKQTDPSNLICSALYLVKLAAPLSYNFHYLAKLNGTAFMDVLGVMQIIPVFGTAFQLFCPCFLIIFALINYFNLFSRLMSAIGLEEYTFSSFDKDKYSFGKEIIDREREKHLVDMANAAKRKKPFYYEGFREFFLGH